MRVLFCKHDLHSTYESDHQKTQSKCLLVSGHLDLVSIVVCEILEKRRVRGFLSMFVHTCCHRCLRLAAFATHRSQQERCATEKHMTSMAMSLSRVSCGSASLPVGVVKQGRRPQGFPRGQRAHLPPMTTTRFDVAASRQFLCSVIPFRFDNVMPLSDLQP